MKKRMIADLILLSVALIWGTTFVVVQNAIAILPPYTFNGIRFSIASILLLLYILMKNRKGVVDLGKKGWRSGIILGIFLFGGYAFQTIGLVYTTAAKAGFITGLSVVLVPLFSIFLLKILPKWPTILGVSLATIGLYLMTMIEGGRFAWGDTLVFLCAIFFALHIVFMGRFAPQYETLPLAWIQITTVALLNGIMMFFFDDFEQLSFHNFIQKDVLIAILITSLFATVFAYVAQTTFQSYTTPTRVAIIFAMEPVFAAITSYIVHDEVMNHWTIIGGLLIFIGMIMVELPKDLFQSFFQLIKRKGRVS
ncbi:DMT family transporter [Tepidibacillus fermentans]|uniref:Drug/metabolite transporter (DMT)-like permease n=1 Tax=Tepidibacillus fermentans TaxID=1281767 RepID=A0A4V2USZ4_9BACI|nr:DMT family transporter [Tepidibacillus fermentans]TCS83481.1 drug/metabolite transporter (DMT)-like permease [Tepidibacillus fermentans]